MELETYELEWIIDSIKRDLVPGARVPLDEQCALSEVLVKVERIWEEKMKVAEERYLKEK